ncbi:MAG: dTDP-4-dehydrorhamnose 3,5-epimerase [Bacteroidota bacterium]
MQTGIEGLLVIEPKVFGDDRGYFFESFNCQEFNVLAGQSIQFVQDNESKSSRGVLRGLHFQNPPHAQGKLVRVVKGSVQDVVVDLRKDSATYGQHFSIVLSEKNKFQMWIPPGFAHGFATLEDDTIFQYKCSEFYFPASEGCILWNDPHLKIDWLINNPILSEKDKKGRTFVELITPF